MSERVDEKKKGGDGREGVRESVKEREENSASTKKCFGPSRYIRVATKLNRSLFRPRIRPSVRVRANEK